METIEWNQPGSQSRQYLLVFIHQHTTNRKVVIMCLCKHGADAETLCTELNEANTRAGRLSEKTLRLEQMHERENKRALMWRDEYNERLHKYVAMRKERDEWRTLAESTQRELADLKSLNSLRRKLQGGEDEVKVLKGSLDRLAGLLAQETEGQAYGSQTGAQSVSGPCGHLVSAAGEPMGRCDACL